MRNKALILFIFLLSAAAWSSIPTTEGLFRNANNADVSANLIVVKFLITLKPSTQVLETQISDVPEEKIEELAKEEEKKFYVKFLFSVDSEDRVQVIQAIYNDGKMEDSHLVDARYISNLENKVKATDNLQSLFYSTISSLALNRSKEINTLLKTVSKNYKSNEDLIDAEKMALYSKYKRYLSLVKEDENFKETLENPWKPADGEGKELVEQIKNRPFMNRDPHVQLVKDQNGFVWKTENDVMTAIFENKTMRLEKLAFGKLNKNLKINFDDYLLFDGSHELPKHIKIDAPESFFDIRTLSLRHLMIGNKSMPKRYSEYKDLLKESKATKEVNDLTSIFLMR